MRSFATIGVVNRDTINTTAPLPEEGRKAHEAQRPYLFVVLHCDQPTFGGARYDLSAISEVTIGRGSARQAVRIDEHGMRKLDVRLPSSTVSKAHVRLIRKQGEWQLTDLGSKNGCCLNGKRVTNATVHDGDMIEVGSVVLRYRLVKTVSAAVDVDSASFAAMVPGYASLLPDYATRLDALARVARLDFTTLLLGETGTGKEVLASGTHRLSGRSGPFIAVNCGALPATLVESQLFGHVKGSFTGAQRDELGVIRSAHGGTLFLDEIGDLPLPAQGVLLRVLQQREVVPVGGTRPSTVDVRFIAATNKSLDELCLRGEFRSDLLARLATYKLLLQPLHERIEDMGILIAGMLQRSPNTNAQHARFSVSAGRSLLNYSWPHNIRELEGVLGIAVALAEGNLVDRFELSNLEKEELVLDEPPRNPDELRERLVSLLQQHRGNATLVARSMNKSRVQIYRWLKMLGIDLNEFREKSP